MFRKRAKQQDEEHADKKHRAYELSIAGRYDGIFALADDQRPGDGDVSILRVRLPPQFEMSGELEMTVDDLGGGPAQEVRDGGVGLRQLATKSDTNFDWTNVINYRVNTYATEPTEIMNGTLLAGWSGSLPTTAQHAILDVQLRNEFELNAIYFWPKSGVEGDFPAEIVIESLSNFQSEYSGDGTYINVEDIATSVDTINPTQPAWNASDPPKVTTTGSHRYAALVTGLHVTGFVRIRVSDTNDVSGSFAVGEIMLVGTMLTGEGAQTRLDQPYFEGTPFTQGSRLHVNTASFYEHDGTSYSGPSHAGRASADETVLNSFAARTQLRNVVLDAFIATQSVNDEVLNITSAPQEVTGLPSFMLQVTQPMDVLQFFVLYGPPGTVLSQGVANPPLTRKLLYAKTNVTAGFYYVTHREALFPLAPGVYQADTSLPLVAVVSHSAVPTLAFESTGDSAYGVCSLQVDNFFGTVSMNSMLQHRLGLPVSNGFVHFTEGRARGVTKLNDVQRISLYLEPSVQFHVSSHLGLLGDAIADNTLTVISFTISGDDLADTVLYSLGGDFDVNSARMTSNKSAQIQFKLFKDVYDSLTKEYVSKPVLVSNHEFVEIKMVVTQEAED